ncbi:MAG: D-amino acid dehydrogenase 1 [Paracidovorax wautersii]|uniref:D-amino acid dehydrogenase 1 n=1 Tax=Paracidovorax wautersii TaxID=1177982 RepID=A0A7V8JR32_9BURK|nr:MAG: D-amino acid dehydrogenase 1 [Paracidovorax wautersii]
MSAATPTSSPAIDAGRRHVVVIGAGVVGVASAIEALRAGLAVTLLDPHASGSPEAASYGNAGWLSSHSVIPPAGPDTWRQVPGYLLDPQGPLALRWGYLPRALPWLVRYLLSGRTPERVARAAHALRALLQDAPALHQRLAQEAGCAELIEQRGLLHVYPDRAAFKADGLGWRLRRNEDIAFDTLDADALRAAEPDLAARYQFGVRVPEAGHCRNPGAYVAALAAHAQTLGAVRVAARATSQGDIDCQATVLAAGAWSAPLAAAAGDRVSLDTERGYHVMADLPGPPGPRTPTMVMDRKFIAHQMAHGLRVAGQVEIGGLSAAPDWRRAAILRAQLAETYPALPRDALQEAKLWMGRRPSTPDGLPCIGAASGCADVIHAYGHGHIGLGSSARTGRVVAQLLAGQPPEIDLAPFSPQRWRR